MGIVDSFQPPEGTKSADGKLFAFARLQMQRESDKCMREANALSAGARLARRKEKALPREALYNRRRAENLDYQLVARFADLWKLNEASKKLLRKLPRNILLVLINSYRPPTQVSDG